MTLLEQAEELSAAANRALENRDFGASIALAILANERIQLHKLLCTDEEQRQGDG